MKDVLIQTETLHVFEQYLSLVLHTHLDACEEIAVKIIDSKARKSKAHFPNYFGEEEKSFLVIRVGGGCASKDSPRNYFKGYGPWRLFNRQTTHFDNPHFIVKYVVENIVSKIKKKEGLWKKQFLKKHCNNTYSKSTPCIGYQIAGTRSNPEEVAISLIYL